MWVENVLSGTQLSNLLKLEVCVPASKESHLDVVMDKMLVPVKFCTYSYVYCVFYIHQPSKNGRDHGENGLPTILHITVTRRILSIPAAVIFIPWPLGSNQYLFCHHNIETEILLAS